MMRNRLPPKAAWVLRRLLDGNERYLHANHPEWTEAVQSSYTKHSENPYAVVLTCSSSHIPLERIFSVEVGELFVLRTAGSTVNPAELESVVYALAKLSPSLILVLGNHGTPLAAQGNTDEGVGHRAEPLSAGSQDCRTCGLDSVRNSMALLEQNTILTRMKRAGRAALVGGIYDVETGQVNIHCFG